MSKPEALGYRLRQQQQKVLAYDGGRVAVSAVPGSGKTLTLALLAARLIVEGRIDQEAEVLVVTVQNSAVDNIASRIQGILQQQRLPPVGFRVCTLHKLASDILRQRYDLAGVEDGFQIVEEAGASRLMQSAADVWIANNRAWWDSYLPDGNRRTSAESLWRRETEKLGKGIAKLCKHMQLSPEDAWRLLGESGERSDDALFLRMGIQLYARYQRYLQTRTGLDFDDLIWRAIDALEQDSTFLRSLRLRWPYVLEDEAQDSSPLQERILRQIAGDQGNWVRVGDPNQSINSTFTSADPRYFRRFLRTPPVTPMLLPESGRCAQPIIDLANYLVRWACDEHPEPAIRTMAFERQMIVPTGVGDPQPNPPTEESHIYFAPEPYPSGEDETKRVAEWASSYARRYPDRTAAVLCPAQWQGSLVVEAIQERGGGVPVDDLLRSTPQTREVARVLQRVLAYLSNPTSRKDLMRLYGELGARGHLGREVDSARLRVQRALVNRLLPQDLLFPQTPDGARAQLRALKTVDDEDLDLIEQFALLVAQWMRAASLPIDQLILTVAQDLFQAEADLALCQSVANSLLTTSSVHPNWRLADFATELDQVAQNKRSLQGLALTDSGYVARPGRVAVTTMHKAKGLEWDAVYLIFVNNLEFPDTCQDTFRDEPSFMPGRAPAVEARKRLEQMAGAEFSQPEDASLIEAAHLEYIAERLRLLYVGVTRARRDLALTCSLRKGNPVRPALGFLQLKSAHEQGWVREGRV